MSHCSHAPESLTRQRTGLTPVELALVVAALACEETGGYPTAGALAALTGASRTATSRLLSTGWLERAERSERGYVLRGSSKAWRLYELGEADTSTCEHTPPRQTTKALAGHRDPFTREPLRAAAARSRVSVPGQSRANDDHPPDERLKASLRASVSMSASGERSGAAGDLASMATVHRARGHVVPRLRDRVTGNTCQENSYRGKQQCIQGSP